MHLPDPFQIESDHNPLHIIILKSLASYSPTDCNIMAAIQSLLKVIVEVWPDRQRDIHPLAYRDELVADDGLEKVDLHPRTSAF